MIAGLMVVCYVFAMFGVPAAQPVQEALLDGPYPCQDGACGCRSARECWRSCCCLTDQQKLAWADENNVTPPADFLRRMDVLAVSLRGTSPRTVPRCDVSPEPARPTACCRASAAKRPPAISCCRSGGNDSPGPASNRFVITVEAFKCRGLGTDWTGMALAVLPVPRQVWPIERLVTLAALPAACGTPELSFPPPSPPPRV